MLVTEYRLQDYDIVQLKNGIIALYYEYSFIVHNDLFRSMLGKYETVNTHTAFNKPKYTGNNKIDDLVVVKVKHNKTSLIDMECILNIYENYNIDWDIIF